MAIIHVGAGSYLDYVPSGQVGVTKFGGVPISPSVASDFTGAIPTNDWASSLAYHFYDPAHPGLSGAMYADPISMKASQYGLNLSYTQDPVYIYDEQGHQVKYEFRFHQDGEKKIYGDLSVGLDGMSATNGAVLEKASDYFVTALWKDSDSANQLHATFGHGSPYTFYERDGNADVVIKVNAFSINSIGQPNSTTEAFQIDHVNGVYNGGQINMDFIVNAVAGSGSAIANATQARVSIDHNGDGKFDYIHTLNFYPLDADSTRSEHYLQNEGRGIGASTVGTLQNLNNASIKVEVWKSDGTGDVQITTGANASHIVLPFNALSNQQGALSNTLFLDNNGSANVLSAVPTSTELITLGASPSVGPSVDWDGAGDVWYHDHNVVGITINGAHYGLFAPVGSEWNLDNGEIRSNLNGKDYFSTVLLPDPSVDTLQYFYQHAFAFVTDSKATFDYDEDHAKVITDFNVSTELKEPGFSDETLTTLYRHQWINSDDPLTDYVYASARGEMKLLEGNSFTTETAYTGMLPALPNLLDATKTQQLYQLVDLEYQNLLKPDKDIPGLDTYFVGKALQRLGELAQIADQVGHDNAKEYFIQAMKTELQDWFTATGEGDDKQFVYNAEWDTFQGYPASFESQKELNDHHFHAAYFVKAAAMIAQFDPAWVNQYGGMVDLLIKDVANIDRSSTLFPYLRSFDPYAGHSWANGHGAFAAGNNQESTSEALNFASALVMWGAQINNQGYQDIGAYLFATELAAVQQYWFDQDNAVFPDGYVHSAASILWADGATYSTFFGGMPEFPEFIHAIQFLPMSGGSLYLGLNPQNAQINYNELVLNNGGDPNQWVNILMQYQAMFDAQAAVQKLNNGFASLNEPYFEQGDSQAHTYHWVQNFNAFGKVHAGVTADTPFFAVFDKSGLLTYTAYNPSDAAITVHFSDGTTLVLAAEELKAVNHNVTWSSVTGAIVNPNPIPVPDPVPDPTPDPVPQPDPVPTPVPDPVPIPQPLPGDINGTAGNDFLSGTLNNDVINGLAGNDQLHGLEGNDVINAGNGDDHIYGNAGNDVLNGGAGKDFLVGGAGNDIYKYNAIADSVNASRDFIETFEQGKDKMDLSALNVGFQQLVFSSVDGYTHIGIAGSDFSIRIGNGVQFAAGDFVLSDAPQPIPDPVPQPDPIPTPDPVPVPVPQPGDINGTAGNDFLSATLGNDVVNGLAGSDQLHGLEGADVLNAGEGDDHVYGNAGNDVLNGGAGKDFLVGGDGNDVFKYNSVSDSTNASRDFIETFEQGKDKMDLSALNVSFQQLVFSSVDGYTHIGIAGSDFSIRIGNGVQFAAGDFVLSGAAPQPVPTPIPDPIPAPQPQPGDINGTVGNDFLSGTVNNDAINGLAGNDQLHGIEGNDVLRGNAGDDALFGNAGSDVLIGGAGKDFLVGGDGKDVYQFENLTDSVNGQRDVVEGFRHGDDKLDLTLLHVAANDVQIAMANGITTVSIANSSFAVDFIASDQIAHDDILT